MRDGSHNTNALKRPEDRRTVLVNVRFTPSEADALAQFANVLQMSSSRVLQALALQALRLSAQLPPSET